MSLPCGAVSCAIPAQSCCVESGGGFITYLCVVGPSANCAASRGGDLLGLKCSSAANCAATEQCCANVGTADAVQSSCVPKGTCAAGPGGPEHAILCDPNATAGASGCGDAGACDNGTINDWGLPDTFGTCGNRPGPF